MPDTEVIFEIKRRGHSTMGWPQMYSYNMKPRTTKALLCLSPRLAYIERRIIVRIDVLRWDNEQTKEKALGDCKELFAMCLEIKVLFVDPHLFSKLPRRKPLIPSNHTTLNMFNLTAVSLHLYCKFAYKNGVEADDCFMVIAVQANWTSSRLKLWGNKGKDIDDLIREGLRKGKIFLLARSPESAAMETFMFWSLGYSMHFLIPSPPRPPCV
ncbi:hypothetical protein K504DRAFT_454162 [Pleomassaria siparia CBS 279.74]|uniref:Uncharacterized protein n=1 Tax=Pleomassaria siparia CBS 279.74 TaxID=1314801 RepID=A0A6G1KEV3_9PLEO|nr:hypothetical protein K504DRAFT_454162 [Pleomassaria siparia CBS 279.74]